MNQAEYIALRATFPWTERVIPTKQGGVVQVLDRNGQEVPLFTITKFLSFITTRLIAAPAPAPAEATTPENPA